MKYYTLKFVLAFVGYCLREQPSDLRRAILVFEEEFNCRLPKDFDLFRMIVVISAEYGITTDEFRSSFKYGKLGEARQMLCAILSTYNLKPRIIAEMTGYTQSRVINSIRTANERGITELLNKIKKDYENTMSTNPATPALGTVDYSS